MAEDRAALLNESEKPTARHYTILAMSWAGWLLGYLSFGVVADWRGRRGELLRLRPDLLGALPGFRN